MISVFGQPSSLDDQGEIGVPCVSARIQPAQTPQTLELLVYTVASSEARTSPVTTGSVGYFFRSHQQVCTKWKMRHQAQVSRE
jgi:hypothetical protein